MQNLALVAKCAHVLTYPLGYVTLAARHGMTEVCALPRALFCFTWYCIYHCTEKKRFPSQIMDYLLHTGSSVLIALCCSSLLAMSLFCSANGTGSVQWIRAH